MRPILTTASRRLLFNGRITSVRSLNVGLIRRDAGAPTMRCNGRAQTITSADGGGLARMAFRRSLSTTDASLPLASSSSLGIFESLVLPHLDSLSALPEVSAALATPSADKSTIEGLTRAVQIFESMKGSPLHVAVQCLLADGYQQTGQYKQAIQVLEQLLQQGEQSPNNMVNIQLALSKALFHDGDFERALGATSDLLDSPQVQSSVVARGTVLCAQGTIRLVQLNKDDDGYEQAQEVIKVLRVAAKSLESHGDIGAAAYNNLGVAQIVSELVFLDRVRVDSAMSCLHQGLDMASADNDLVKGRIYSNMAHVLLMEDDDDDDMLKLASEYAREALRIYEKSTQLSDMEKQAGLGRSLNLVASCYVRADAAVTAEGLLQTAIDMPGVDPLTKIARREVYRTYSELCRKWEKREADKDRLEKESVEINDSLAKGWKDKPGLMSGLLFCTM